MKKLQIGNVTLDNPIILAPMAGVSDLPFRLLCREMGAALVCMEMVSAKAIYYNNKILTALWRSIPTRCLLPCSCSVRIRRSLRRWQNASRSVLFHSGPEHGMPGTKGSE